MSEFSGATGIKTHTLGGRNNRHVLCHSSGAQKSGTQSWVLLRLLREDRVPAPYPLLVASWQPLALFLPPCMSDFVSSWPSSSVSAPSYKGTTQIGLGIISMAPFNWVPSKRPYLPKKSTFQAVRLGLQPMIWTQFNPLHLVKCVPRGPQLEFTPIETLLMEMPTFEGKADQETYLSRAPGLRM